MKSLKPWETKTDAPSNVQFRKIRKGHTKIIRKEALAIVRIDFGVG